MTSQPQCVPADATQEPGAEPLLWARACEGAQPAVPGGHGERPCLGVSLGALSLGFKAVPAHKLKNLGRRPRGGKADTPLGDPHTAVYTHAHAGWNEVTHPRSPNQ